MGKGHQEGFTLVELMAVLMVVGIALGMGIPAMSNFAANSQMAAATTALLAALQAARQAALSSNSPVTLCASDSWNSAGAACSEGAPLVAGWIVFRDTNGNGILDGTEGTGVIGRHGPVAEGIQHNARTKGDAAPPQYVLFDSSGRPQNAGARGPALRNIQLCDPRGAAHAGDGIAAGRWIMLSPAGHPLAFQEYGRVQGPDNPLHGC